MWLPRLLPTLIVLVLRAQPPGCAAAGVPLLRGVGNCDVDGYHGISSRTACQAAARELGLDDTVARPFTRPSRPHGCYYKADNVNANRRLFFNADGDRASADTARTSLCVPTNPECRDEYGPAFKPWEDFVSCEEEREYCAEAPTTLQRFCRRTCGTCIVTAAPSTVAPTVGPPSATIILREVGNCELEGYAVTTSLDACESAATTLDLTDATARVLSRSSRPHGCYYKANNGNANNRLFYNRNGDRASQDSARVSICVLGDNPGTGGCQDEYNQIFKPWEDFVSCAAEREFCSLNPDTLQRFCRRTCGTCIAEPTPPAPTSRPTTAGPTRAPTGAPTPAPAAPTAGIPTPSTPASGWRRHAGTHCHQGLDGFGGTMIDLQQSPAATGIDAAACQELCEGTDGCVGVTTAVADYAWTTYLDKSCYAGAGAIELTLPSAPGPDDCYNMALSECQTQCVLTEGCTGVVWAASGDDIGLCCVRANIQLSECDGGDGQWNTYTLAQAPGSGACWRLSAVDIGQCDTEREGHDTYVKDPQPQERWWLTTNFVERVLMPRHYRCSSSSPAPGTCRFSDLQALLPSLQQSGYSVLNVDWPVHASPDTLFMGFGINRPYAVDPLLGSDADWERLVDAVHARGMKMVIDFNPSYWWTGSPSFKQAISDVRAHGLSNLPASSPARWFRWKASCPGARTQPPDNFDDLNEFTDAWVLSLEAGACYWAIWGGSDDLRYGGQPTADLTSPEWQAELTSILSHWVSDRGVDGFLIDAPPELLSVAEGLDVALHHRTTAKVIHSVIVEPVHALGAAVFGEMYNLQVPTIAKMFDGGRNTDMGGHGNSVVKGFPSLLSDMVASQDASGFEMLLQTTVDVYTGWCGTVRTEPHSAGPAAVAGIKAAATALFAGYYVVRMGDGQDGCSSPYDSGYGPSPPGNEWPGGCFGDWAGAATVAPTLRALSSSRALRPGASRRAFSPGTRQVYAALRIDGPSGDAVIIILNFGSSATSVALSGRQIDGFGIGRSQETVDLIRGGSGPRIGGAGQSWSAMLPARGWAVYAVQLA